MNITDDTDSDSISCPDLTASQAQQLQGALSAALIRNAPVQEVAAVIMATIKAARSA